MLNEQKISRYRELASSLKNSGSYIATGKKDVRVDAGSINDQTELTSLVLEIQDNGELFNMLTGEEKTKFGHELE